MLVLNPVGADALLVTGANDAQLFAYSVPRFQTVSSPPPTLPGPLHMSCSVQHTPELESHAVW